MSAERERRRVSLALRPWSVEELERFGRFRPGGSEGEAAPACGRGIARFWRREGASVSLDLAVGDLIVLGPASDPMRCRALPGEREFRAFRAPVAGVLELEPGTWFHHGAGALEGCEEKDYGDILGIAFDAVEGDPLPEGLGQNLFQPPPQAH